MFDYKLALSQLTNSENSTGVLSSFVGAHNFVFDETEKYVAFKFKAKAKNKANHCKLQLNSDDTYSLIFGKTGNKSDPELKKLGIKYMIPFYNELETIKGLYFDQLKDVFEKETGIYIFHFNFPNKV